MNRLTIGRMQNIVGRHHQHTCFELRLERSGNMHRHLVPIEIALNAAQTSGCNWMACPRSIRFEGLNAKTVQSRAPFSMIGCSRMTSSRISQTRFLLFNQLFCLFDGRR